MMDEQERAAIAREIGFIEIKPEVAERLMLPTLVPVLKSEVAADLPKGELSAPALAAGIEAVKRLKPDLTDYDRFLARYYILEAQRNLQEQPADTYQAQRNYEKALDLGAGEISSEAAFWLGGMTTEADPQLAADYYRRSVELNPGVASPHFELARLLRERRDLDGAMAEFLEAYRLEPTSPFLLIEIGETHMMVNDYAKARAAYARALELDKKYWLPFAPPDSDDDPPLYWITYLKLGQAEYELEEYDNAIRHLRSGLDLAPEELDDEAAQGYYVQGLYQLGLSYRNKGDETRAYKVLRSILTIAPDYQPAIDALNERPG